MTDVHRKKLRRVTIIYWVLLLYIFAALYWWYYSLELQNQEMYVLQKAAIEGLQQTAPAEYNRRLFLIEDGTRRDTWKHQSEGVTFFGLIVFGAAFIYRSVQRQFRLQQQQQNFMMAVTHELKTPIAVSRLNLETMQKHQLPEDKRSRLLRMTLQENLRLDTLINNILLSSQLEANAYKMQHEPVDFSTLVAEVVGGFQARYPDRQVAVQLQEHVTINGDVVLLNLLVSNLLENAHKYSPKTSAIEVQLESTAAGAQLQVIDQGEGIPEAEKGHVFEKFYRIGNEQTRKAKGTGLGLWLCRKIAQDHGAQIRIADGVPTGSIFIVQF